MRSVSPPGHRLYSSIEEGSFPEGAQLPWEHPDQIRILNVLEGNDPDTPSEPPKAMTLTELRDEKIADDSDDFWGRMGEIGDWSAESYADRAISNFLLNFLSLQRASGCFPDVDFNAALRECMTPAGRKAYAEFISEQMPIARLP